MNTFLDVLKTHFFWGQFFVNLEFQRFFRTPLKYHFMPIWGNRVVALSLEFKNHTLTEDIVIMVRDKKREIGVCYI